MQGTKHQHKPFCAVCVKDICGDVYREPLGRNDALVNCCSSCATATVRARDNDRGYESKGASLKADEITAAMRRVMGDEAYEREQERVVRAGMAPTRPLTQEENDIQGFRAEGRRRNRTRAENALHHRREKTVF